MEHDKSPIINRGILFDNGTSKFLKHIDWLIDWG